MAARLERSRRYLIGTHEQNLHRLRFALRNRAFDQRIEPASQHSSHHHPPPPTYRAGRANYPGALAAPSRSRISIARLRYFSAPADLLSYSRTDRPWLGLSESRTLRGITLAKTLSGKCRRTSLAISCESRLRESNIVSTSPSISSDGRSAVLTLRIVASSEVSPSSA